MKNNNILSVTIISILISLCYCEDKNLDMINKCKKIILYGSVNQVYEPSIAEAIMALGLLGDERAIELIGDVLKNHDNDDVRHKCVRALGWIKSKKSIPYLEDALNDKYVHAKEVAAIALKDITGKQYAVTYTPEELAEKKKFEDEMKRMLDSVK